MKRRLVWTIALCALSAATTRGQSPPADGLLGRWVFDAQHVRGKGVKAAAGSNDATVVGSVHIDGNPQALRLDGISNLVVIGEDITEVELPKEAFTAEAWVAVDTPLPWGGIVGAFQDNGTAEEGWVLGYRDLSFSLGLSTSGADDGDGMMTYLTSDTPFVPGQWYHVVGAYDGTEMRLYVNGELRGASTEQSGPINYPETAFYEIGAYHDQDELFRCKGRFAEVRVYDRALSGEEIQANSEAKSFETAEPFEPALGPYLQFTGHGRAAVHWRTAEAIPSIVEFGFDGRYTRHEDLAPKTSHSLELTGLGVNTAYQYRILSSAGDEAAKSAWYECDTMFNYAIPALPDGPAPFPDDALTRRCAEAAQRIVNQTGVTRGYCIVAGNGTGRLAYELARRTQLYVVGVDTDEWAVAEARAALAGAGVYGSRVNARHVASLSALPFTSCFANLVVSERTMSEGVLPGTAAEAERILRPNGGVAFLGQPQGAANARSKAELAAWLDTSSLDSTISVGDEGLWAKAVRPPLEGAGTWSHQYGSPDNSARSHDSLLGATGTDDLAVQWFGRPGSRAMVDRNPRVPAPLYMNGRLFTQGYHRLIAQDAYNGAILWALEIPHIERFNMPRDSSNWCADDGHLYAAIRNACWRINAATGELDAVYDVTPLVDSDEYEWGYVASAGDLLFGSAVRTFTAYTNFWGGATAGWYDKPAGPVTNKVCSDTLFAMAKESGELAWSYTDAVVINTTITLAEGMVYFVECRNEAVKAAQERRVGMPELWQDQYLVALDAATGAKVWERPLDTADGTVVFYMLHVEDALVIGLSNTKYHLYSFEASNGEPRWETSHDWTASDHSGHMQHPVVVGGTVYLEPCGYDLATGERVTDAMARHDGCATYAGTEGALIYRGTGRQVAMWDVATGQVTVWKRLRPGCWLTTIAGGGMVLSPEGGGGCSCGGWMETSIAFMRADAGL
jgi:outer membrane protein assembly factor BamB